MLTAELPTIEKAKELGLLEEEYNKICEILGRNPNFTELSIYSVMWSERCSGKNSIALIKTLPEISDEGIKPGMIDVGEGAVCSFKIHSTDMSSDTSAKGNANNGFNNFVVGTEPMAQVTSLNFGSLDSDDQKKTLKGLVEDIGAQTTDVDFSQSRGVLFLDECYNEKPVLNTFSVGISSKDKMVSTSSIGEGNLIFIVSAGTKEAGKLSEVTKEMIESDCIVGLHDMGAAGIAGSSAAMSSAGELGMDVHLDQIFGSKSTMQPQEVLLSELAGQVLVAVEKGKEKALKDLCSKQDINAVEIGVVTKGGNLRYYMGGDLIAEIPATSLIVGGGAPVYEPESKQPKYFAVNKKFDIQSIDDIEFEGIEKVARAMMVLPNITSKGWIANQLVADTSSDANVVWIDDSKKAIALTLKGNSRYMQADPEQGASIAIATASRNIICSGGAPWSIATSMNFGNPSNKESYWQFAKAIKGLGRGCEQFNISGSDVKVDFENDSSEATNVFPSLNVGMVGLLEDKEKQVTTDFKRPGDLIYLLGRSEDCISSSEYLNTYKGIKESPAPMLDLNSELILQFELKRFIQMGFIKSAHGVSEGGLYTALVEGAIAGNVGFDIMIDDTYRIDAFLFGESQGRIVVSVSKNDSADFEDMLMESKLKDFIVLGEVIKDGFLIDEEFIMLTSEAKEMYDDTLATKLG